MKISGFYKKAGHDVELLEEYDGISEYDKVFLSKVFEDTPVPSAILDLGNVSYGGTGFYYDKAPALPDNIEHHYPDYHLYDSYIQRKISSGIDAKKFTYYTDYSIGYTTRGCIRQCQFCVNKNYKKCNLHSPVSEFLNKKRPHICLLDDNIFACQNWRSVFEELQSTKKGFQFKQGLDERLLTEEKCDVLFKSKWIGDFIFAFDNIKDTPVIVEKLKMLRRHTDKRCKFYTFCAFNHDAPDKYSDTFWSQDIECLFRRIEILSRYKCTPYIMRYKDYALSPHRGMYIAIASWCNQPGIFRKTSFREFCNARAERKRYMESFQEKYPVLAQKYFDFKYT